MNTHANTRTLTAFYDTRAEAEAARDRVVAEGVAQSSVHIVEGAEGSTQAQSAEPQGFWDSLSDFFLPDDDRAVYTEGLRRGGYMLTAHVEYDHVARVTDILDADGTVDLDARSEEWRAEGWSGYAGAGAAGAAAGGAAQSATAEGGKIDVVEENLRVGKRDVETGRVRVRSYVVEEPVSEDVTLREEHVSLKRTPVDRPAEGTAGFKDATITAEEHSEEAVVQKEARVVEEIELEKDVTQRTETVSDTVRHTEVEVEGDVATRQGTDPKR